MRGILFDTIAEMLDRKMVVVYSIMGAIGILILVVMRTIDVNFEMNGVDLQAPTPAMSDLIMGYYNRLMYFMVFLSVMATAGLIPNMLAKGRADFYLSKPLSRKTLLLSKLFAIWLVYGFLMILVLVLNWVVGGLLHGFWSFGIVYIALTNMLVFFIWLCVTAFGGILSGSGMSSMMLAFGVWFVQFLLLGRGIIEKLGIDWLAYIVNGLYYVLPKTGEIYDISGQMISGLPVNWMPLYSSLAFAFVLMYVTVSMFNRKDY